MLPDDTALGPLPSANSGRPIASYDTSSIGAGLNDLGKGVSTAAKDLADVQASQQKQVNSLQKAQADAALTSGVVTLNSARDDEDDVAKLQTVPAQHSQILTNASQFITDPAQRQLWVTQNAPTVASQVVATKDRIFDVQQDKAFASTTTQLSDLIKKGALAKTDAERGAVVTAGQGLIDNLENAGYISETDAAKRRLDFANGYAVSAFNSMPADQRLTVLREAPQGREATLDRIGGIENSSGDPAARSATSSAMGDFQFTNKTWLDTIQAHRPDLKQGRDDQTLLDLRADPKLSREMAGYLMDDNSAALKGAGVDATPGNLYLAHFLGAGDAAKVLKAPSGTPVADILSPQVIAANASVLAGKTTGTVQAWSDQKMGAGAPDAQGASLLKFMTPDQVADVKQKAQTDFRAVTLDGQRVAQLTAAKAEDVSNSSEMGYMKDIYSPAPQTTVQTIVNDDKLTREAKTRLLSVAERVLTDKTDTTYGPGFYEAYQRVHAPDGSPGKITDPTELFKRVGKDGDLTVAGADKLVTEIQGKKTPDGESEAQIAKSFLAAVRTHVTGANPQLKLEDPKGDDLFIKYLPTYYSMVTKMKNDGKTISEIYSPDGPLMKAADALRRPDAVWMADIMAASSDYSDKQPAKAATPEASFDIKSVKSLDDLVAAYKAGRVPRAAATQMAIDKGWATSGPAASTSAPALVPVSQ